MTSDSCRRLIVIFLLLFSVACAKNHPWYLVESSFRVQGLPEREREVTTAPAHGFLPERMAVAVRAPDTCANQSAAEATGEVAPQGELLRMSCGVEMAEVEKVLVKSGYRVYSWSEIEQMVVRQQDTTPIAAAKSLGADILFQINSLERSKGDSGHNEIWSRQYYESDMYGNRGQPAHVPEERAHALEDAVRWREREIRPDSETSVTANVTATLVATGESIWFYEWTVAEPLEDGISSRQLFLCNKDILSRCLPRQPMPAKNRAPLPSVSSQSLRTGSRGEAVRPRRNENERDAVYYALVREIVEDIVREFGKRQQPQPQR